MAALLPAATHVFDREEVGYLPPALACLEVCPSSYMQSLHISCIIDLPRPAFCLMICFAMGLFSVLCMRVCARMCVHLVPLPRAHGASWCALCMSCMPLLSHQINVLGLRIFGVSYHQSLNGTELPKGITPLTYLLFLPRYQSLPPQKSERSPGGIICILIISSAPVTFQGVSENLQSQICSSSSVYRWPAQQVRGP